MRWGQFYAVHTPLLYRHTPPIKEIYSIAGEEFPLHCTADRMVAKGAASLVAWVTIFVTGVKLMERQNALGVITGLVLDENPCRSAPARDLVTRP